MPTRLSVFGVPIPENAIQGRRVLPLAFALIAALAAIESYYRFDFSLGVLCAIPVLMASSVLTRWQIVLFGLFAALARTPFTPAASTLEAFLKFVMASLAYTTTGLLLVEMSYNRRRLLESFARVQTEQALRHAAEEQLRTLADSSPAAILTLDAYARVLAANRSAHEMLGAAPGTLIGTTVDHSLPMFANALKVASNDRAISTSVAGWARRADTPLPRRGVVLGVRPRPQPLRGRHRRGHVRGVRDRERSFQHLLDYNAAGQRRVARDPQLLLGAVGRLFEPEPAHRPAQQRPTSTRWCARFTRVDGAGRLRPAPQRHDRRPPVGPADGVRSSCASSSRPDWDEIGGQVVWDSPPHLPVVSANAHGLLQIFLNLCQNSLRAVERTGENAA